MASGANTSAEDLPTPDVVGTTAMAAGNAKVALVSSTTALPSNTCPTGDTVVDAVGYSSTGCAEIAITGTTNLSNNQSALRDEDRCGDTFSIISPPEPENTTAPLTPCTTGGGEDGEPIVPVCDDMTLARSEGGSVTLTASDADGTVTDAAITAGATDGISLTDPDPAGNVGGTFTVELAADDTLGARDYPVQVTFSNDDETPQTASCTATITVFLAVPDDVCEVDPAELTVINEIQGSGPSTPIEGEFVVTRGVVTTAFPSGGSTGLPNNHGLRGFFIEAVEADRDGDPQTSEGLFVFDFDGVYASEVGDLVYVAGTAGEGFDVTRISSNTFRSCDVDGLDTTLPAPTELPLPVAPSDRAEVLEPLESMRVTHPELTLVEFFELERFGQVRLSSAGVFQNPTNVVEPGSSAYTDLFDFNAANNILLSAGWTGQNINRPGPDGTPPLPYLEPGDTLRIGDQLIDQTFVLHYSFSNWRLQPVDIDELSDEFQANRTRPRPQTPPTAGGSLTVASFNVLNYFNGDGYFVEDDLATAQGFPNARGAVTPSEFRRQTEKIVDALIRMDADIVGLVEIENDAGDRQAAAALVEAVNDELRDEVYDYLDTGVIGTDAIKLAYIYKPSTVELSGDYAVLDSETDPRFDDGRSRPALAQTFTELATGESVTVTVNHLKSKGQSGLNNTEDPDYDQGDGQGFWNPTRTAAAEALADWLDTDPTQQAAAGDLIIGDLNAYAMEDPIVALREAGYTDLLDAFAPDGEMPYTYTFDGTQGYLDHALADEELLPFVTGAAAWNINADEVPAIDYLESCCGVSGNSRFRTAEVAAQYYESSAFRSSDHDPVLVGLDLAGEDENQPPTVEDLELSTHEDTPVNGQLILDDPDDDPLTVTYGAPANGSVTGDNDGAFTYTPNAGFTGIDTFEVTVDDGRGGTDSGTVTIKVREVEEPPSAPITKDDCKDGGWRGFEDPSFRNQGQCVASVVSDRDGRGNAYR